MTGGGDSPNYKCVSQRGASTAFPGIGKADVTSPWLAGTSGMDGVRLGKNPKPLIEAGWGRAGRHIQRS